MTKTNEALKKLGTAMQGTEPKGEHTWEILDSMAFNAGLALTVTPATDADDLFDKQASDLQENIHVGENAITGTLKYVTGYQAYAGDEQNGNFLALKAVANMDGCAIIAGLVGGAHGNVHLESDGLIVFRVTSTEQKVRFVVSKGDNSKEFIYDLDDIILGQPAAETATLTYAMGQDADGGSVPSSVTEEVGETVNVSFTPHPTREGYIFVGWATTERSESADYSDGGTSEITLYGGVTLYPVWVEEVTLTYEMGSYADGGSVPSSVTTFRYDDIIVDFNTHPTREGYDFIGWATTDGADHASYYEDMDTPTVHMSSDVTLYPVFEEQQSGGGGGTAGTIEIVNNSSKGYSVEAKEGKSTVVLTVAANTSDTFTFTAGTSYNIVTDMTVGEFTGVYKGNTYTNKTLEHTGDHFNSPASVSDSEQNWTFNANDYGTITVS